jgi:hypothetical protein
MNPLKQSFKKGQIVLAQGHGVTTFKVLEVSTDVQMAEIQCFSLSKQVLLGDVLRKIPTNTLMPFKEDASQAAARIVREATEDR